VRPAAHVTVWHTCCLTHDFKPTLWREWWEIFPGRT